MFGVESAHVQFIQEPNLIFDLHKVQQVYDNYTVNYHAGLTMVMGHPFGDITFRQHIIEEQEAIKKVFITQDLEDLLILYDAHSQVHATLVELASQHDKERNDQQLLTDDELTISSKTARLMNINYSIDWIKKTEPFEIELGPDVLAEGRREQSLRITDTGQIVMKGRANDRNLLAQIRAEFEDQAGIVHKYGKDDDEFFFVIGYLKPDPRLNDTTFRAKLEECINSRRPHIKLALKVDSVRIIMYQNYSLDSEACLWESKEFKLLETPNLPQKNVIDSISAIIKERKLQVDTLLKEVS